MATINQLEYPPTIEKPFVFRPICPKHNEFFETYKEGIVYKKDGYEGHFHADIIGCKRPSCIRILITTSNECFCSRTPITPEELRKLIKQSRNH